MNNDIKKADKLEREIFRKDLLSNKDIQGFYSCSAVGCLLPLILLLISSVIAMIVWQSKVTLFLTLLSLAFILVYFSLLNMSIKGYFKQWKENGDRL